jgi:hypothetical protein
VIFWDTVRRFDITGCRLVDAMTRFLLQRPPSDRDHPLRNVISVPWKQDSRAGVEARVVDAHDIEVPNGSASESIPPGAAIP